MEQNYKSPNVFPPQNTLGEQLKHKQCRQMVVTEAAAWAWTEMLKASTCKQMNFRFQKVWFVFQYWTDFYLQWNISDYPGVSNVRFPYNQIWRPDVLLYNRYATTLLQKNKRQSWLCKLTTEPPAAHHLSFYCQKLWYQNNRFELSHFRHPFLWHNNMLPKG